MVFLPPVVKVAGNFRGISKPLCYSKIILQKFGNKRSNSTKGEKTTQQPLSLILRVMLYSLSLHKTGWQHYCPTTKIQNVLWCISPFLRVHTSPPVKVCPRLLAECSGQYGCLQSVSSAFTRTSCCTQRTIQGHWKEVCGHLQS